MNKSVVIVGASGHGKALNEKLTSTFSLFCSTLGTGGGS